MNEKEEYYEIYNEEGRLIKYAKNTYSIVKRQVA